MTTIHQYNPYVTTTMMMMMMMMTMMMMTTTVQKHNKVTNLSSPIKSHANRIM
jgi:hypothetical protein